jgi:acetyl-CoA acetyltransferase family protein
MSAIREAVIVDIVRSPVGKGKAGGSLADLHPVDLLAQTLQGLVARTGIDPGIVEDVLIGCVSQVGEQSATPGRMAWLAAGFPEHVPAVTIDRKCGSSQQAAHFAAQGVMAGAYDIVIAGGVESMSRVVMGSARMGADPYGEGVDARYAPGLVSQGLAAELVADRWNLDREALDAYSAESHARAHAAASAQAFAAEIVPISVAHDATTTSVTADETIRPGTTTESLASLKTVFATDDARARFPDLDFRVTAGNSSQITDGAAAMLIMDRATAERMGLRPRARFHAFSQVGDDPLLMLTGVMPATTKVLERGGLAITDMDHVEVNEAFAPVPLAWLREFGVDDEIVNPRGGAIALGHPLGASGGRLMATMLSALEQNGGRWGLQTMCEAGGMANATIIERLDS